MIKAVLLDMDNTLIANPDRPFAIAFLQELEQALQPYLGNLDTTALYRGGLQQLSGERTGEETNTRHIIRHLSESANVSIETARQALEHFYETGYPQLQARIQPVAGARDLILRLHEMGYTLIIATNPIYPHEAIRQRMEWGNLPLDESLYALITSADNMHFSKPDPAYYAEILGRVGVEPDEAIMFGDRLSSDIEPAKLLGLQTVHHKSVEIGNFLSVLHEMQGIARPTSLQPEGVLAQLRGNIGALFGFVEHVPPHYWLQRPLPSEWSLVQILCHLAEVEAKEHRARLLKILQEDNPFIASFEPPGPNIPCCAEEGISVSATFARERRQTLDLLEALPLADWKRPARHSVFGLTTLIEMAYFTAQHDRLHLNQLCQTIGRCT